MLDFIVDVLRMCVVKFFSFRVGVTKLVDFEWILHNFRLEFDFSILDAKQRLPQLDARAKESEGVVIVFQNVPGVVS